MRELILLRVRTARQWDLSHSEGWRSWGLGWGRRRRRGGQLSGMGELTKDRRGGSSLRRPLAGSGLAALLHHDLDRAKKRSVSLGGLIT